MGLENHVQYLRGENRGFRHTANLFIRRKSKSEGKAMPMSAIAELAHAILDERELALAKHLSVVLGDDRYNSEAVFAAILPLYWRQNGEIKVVLPPRPIFRTLYYVEKYAALRRFREKTRPFLTFLSSHLEGCLFHLSVNAGPYAKPNLTFGRLVVWLRARGSIPEELANQLQAYNKVVNVPSKHFDAFPPPPGLNERTFSVVEAAYSFVMMRKLSMQLFPLLKTRGVIGEVEWPPFNDRWLESFPLIYQRPKSGRG
jgi:hypothetical protein